MEVFIQARELYYSLRSGRLALEVKITDLYVIDSIVYQHNGYTIDVH